MTNLMGRLRRSPSQQLAANVATALAYAIAGRLALLLAIPPGYAAAVWPAAGIAIAAVLMRGFGVLPGVVLGSFLVNATAGWDASSTAAMQRALAIAAAIAVGAGAQAACAAWLLRRSIGYPTALAGDRDGLRFLAFGALIPATISASCGVATLWCAGLFHGVDAAYGWATWWTGDALGSLTFGPLTLMCFAEPRHAWRQVRSSVGGPMLLAVALSVGAFVLANQSELRRFEREFDDVSYRVTDAIERSVQQVTDDVQDLGALFDSSTAVGIEEFRTFAGRTLHRRAGVRALEWAPRVTREGRAGFEAAMRADVPGFGIWSLGADGRPEPAGSREEYYPIAYLEPSQRHLRVFGFDLASEPTRRRTIAAAIESGAPRLSSGVRLVQDDSGEWGTLVVFPVLSRTSGEVLGVIVAVFAAAELVRPLVAQFDPEQVTVELREHEYLQATGEGRGDGVAERVLFATAPVAASATGAAFARQQLLDVPGQTWTLATAGTRAFLTARRPLQSWSILAGGVLFSGLLGIVLLLNAGRTAQVAERVEQRTADLQLSNERLAAKIADHRTASIALRQSQEQLEAAQVRARLGSWELDLGTGAATWSATMFELFGRDPALGVPPLHDFLERDVHPDDCGMLLDVHNWVTDSGQPAVFDVRTSPRDGRSLHLSASVACSVDPTTGATKLVGSVLDVTARKEIEERLRASLREKEVMVQEIHHRVKNNLQIVISLLSMQARRIAQPEVAAILRDSQDRIHAMAQIHENLYRAKDLASIDLPSHVADLCWRIVAAHDLGEDRLQLHLEVEPATLSIEQAVPFSLLLNELIANACKHAFVGRTRGTIRVQFAAAADGTSCLMVADDGVGIGGSPAPGSGLGMHLITTLARQIGATLAIDGMGGTTVRVTFRAENAETLLEPCANPAS